jgi:hypothetical protein
MKVTDWLAGFLAALAESYPPHDWPEPGTEAWAVYVEDFRSAFVRNGVSVAEADDARSLLAENPPRFRQDYIPKVMGAVKIVREMAGVDPAAGAMDDRESALYASKTCIQCFGEGLAIVYASKPSAERKIPETSAAYCVCPYGQWVERTHREKSPDVHKRIPHLSNVLAHRSFWRIDPTWMTAAQGSRNRDPARVPLECFLDDRPGGSVADTIRGWIASVSQSTKAPETPKPRKPEWMGPVPADLPMPPRVAREPEAPPPPVVAPLPQLTPEELEWF